MKLQASRLRVFDVLRNSLTGALGVVMSVSGDRIDLRDKTGANAWYKFGEHFSRVSDDEAVDFRTALRALRKSSPDALKGRKRKPYTAESFLKRVDRRRLEQQRSPA